MTAYELNMLSIVRKLKAEGLVAIKCELEAEGMLRNELTRMAELAWKSNLELYVKIGGCEAVSDLFLCREYNVDGVVAPMIESDFAVEKFKTAVETVYPICSERPSCFINIETEVGLSNAEKMLSVGREFLNGVTIGRGDLSRSMNVKLSDINGEILLTAVKKVAKSIVECGLKCTLGGQIRPNSVDFISGLTPYLSYFETRNLVFDVSRCLSLRKAIEQAVEFELLCLRNRNYHWSTFIDRNQRRIDHLMFAE